MNKRNFLKTLAVAAAGFTVLPAATTYDRIWRVQKQVGMGRVLYQINPAWVTAEYGICYYVDPVALHGQWAFRDQTTKLVEDSAPRMKLINGRLETVHKYMRTLV